MAGITLGTWFRDYNTVAPNLSPEDIAWAILANNPWPCTPQLVAHLTDYIKELEMAKKPKPGKPKPKPGC